MKKVYFQACAISLLFVFVSSTAVGQLISREKSTKIQNNTSFKLELGILNAWSDVMTYQYYQPVTNVNSNQLGAGITLNYQFSKSFYATGHFMRGQLQSVYRTFPLAKYDFKGTGLYFATPLSELSLGAGVNVRNLINYKPKRKLNLDLFVSHGLCYFESVLYDMNGKVYLINKQRGRTGKTTEAVSTYGGMLSYRINDQYDIGISSSLRNVWNDKLDAWIGGDYNDKYSFTTLSLTYHLRPRKRREKAEKVKKEDKEEIGPIIDPKIIEPSIDTLVVDSPVVKPPVIDNKDTITPPPPPVDPVVVDPPKTDTPKVDTPKTDSSKVDTPKTDSPGTSGNVEVLNGVPFSTEKGYFVIVGCFKSLENAQKEAKSWQIDSKSIVNLQSQSGTWYMVATSRHDTRNDALRAMAEVRNAGRCKDAWVHVKR